MALFRFRLEKLLEYRQHREEEAKDEFLERQARRYAAEAEIERLKEERRCALMGITGSLHDRINSERFVERLTDSIRGSEIALTILLGEEETAKSHWLKTKSDAEALGKLREKDHHEWSVEETRREQRDLDEWAVMRRAA